MGRGGSDPAASFLADVRSRGEPGPIPALAGTFVIYEDGKGGYVLVVDVGGEVTHKHIPAAMVINASVNSEAITATGEITGVGMKSALGNTCRP